MDCLKILLHHNSCWAIIVVIVGVGVEPQHTKGLSRSGWGDVWPLAHAGSHVGYLLEFLKSPKFEHDAMEGCTLSLET